jgi:hypothetical protein
MSARPSRRTRGSVTSLCLTAAGPPRLASRQAPGDVGSREQFPGQRGTTMRAAWPALTGPDQHVHPRIAAVAIILIDRHHPLHLVQCLGVQRGIEKHSRPVAPQLPAGLGDEHHDDQATRDGICSHLHARGVKKALTHALFPLPAGDRLLPLAECALPAWRSVRARAAAHRGP